VREVSELTCDTPAGAVFQRVHSNSKQAVAVYLVHLQPNGVCCRWGPMSPCLMPASAARCEQRHGRQDNHDGSGDSNALSRLAGSRRCWKEMAKRMTRAPRCRAAGCPEREQRDDDVLERAPWCEAFSWPGALFPLAGLVMKTAAARPGRLDRCSTFSFLVASPQPSVSSVSRPRSTLGVPSLAQVATLSGLPAHTANYTSYHHHR